MPKQKGTPLGVAIIAILMFIGGILNIIGGITAIIAAPLIPSWLLGLDLILGIVNLVWGIILILAALALLRMEPWAWTFVVVVQIINLILGILSLSIWSIAISLIVLVYMFMKKDEFK